MVKPWGNLRAKTMKNEKNMGKMREKWETYGKTMQFAVKSEENRKTLKNHGKTAQIPVFIVKIQCVSVKIPVIFFITASVSVGPCFSQIFVDSIATIKAILSLIQIQAFSLLRP
jgi:ABC-type bacteriocin/lantibiotic exporter with double-glycine peptidase domain